MGRGKRGLADTIRPYGVTGNDGGRGFGGAGDEKYAPQRFAGGGRELRRSGIRELRGSGGRGSRQKQRKIIFCSKNCLQNQTIEKKIHNQNQRKTTRTNERRDIL